MAQGNSGHFDAAPGDDAARGCPSLIELAAYADSVIDQSDRSFVAQHVARCARCSMIAAHVASEAAAADQMVLTPRHMLERAQALVGGTREMGVNGRARRIALWPALRWVSAAAAAIVISTLGYQVGAGMQNNDGASDQLAIELSFQLMEDSTFDDELQLYPLDQQGAMQ